LRLSGQKTVLLNLLLLSGIVFINGVDAVIGRTTRAYRGAWATYAVATLLALLVPIASFAA